MKKLFKNVPMVLMVMALSVACGKENSSGSSSGSSSVVDEIDAIAGTTNVNEIRKVFEQKSLADGLADGASIEHYGSYFKAATVSQNQGGDCNLRSWDNIKNCLNINVTITAGNQMEVFMDLFDIKRVVSANQDSVSYEIPYDVVNNQYVYQSAGEDFSRTSQEYRGMLSLDQEPLEVRTSPATISFTSGGDKKGTLVEYFYGYRDTITNKPVHQYVRRFVVASSLPTIANPVAVLNDYLISHSGLRKYGNSLVSRVKLSGYTKIEYKQQQTEYGFSTYTVLTKVNKEVISN